MAVEADTGIPLVHVDGKARIALELRGLVDPPNMSTYKVQLTKKGAVVTHSHVEQEEAPPVKTTQTWTLDGGVFTRPAPAE